MLSADGRGTYPFSARHRSTSATVRRRYLWVIRNVESVWLCSRTIASKSVRRFGKQRSSNVFARLFARPSGISTPVRSSICPLRIVSRSHPSSRSAARCPPLPSSPTNRAMKRRRADPTSTLATSLNIAFIDAVSSSIPPQNHDSLPTVNFLTYVSQQELQSGSPLREIADLKVEAGA